MKSVIDLSEVVDNKERRFGSADVYYPSKVIFLNGNELNALFTSSQIEAAIKRAESNPEDVPKKKLLFGIFG